MNMENGEDGRSQDLHDASCTLYHRLWWRRVRIVLSFLVHLSNLETLFPGEDVSSSMVDMVDKTAQYRRNWAMASLKTQWQANLSLQTKKAQDRRQRHGWSFAVCRIEKGK